MSEKKTSHISFRESLIERALDRLENITYPIGRSMSPDLMRTIGKRLREDRKEVLTDLVADILAMR